MEAITLIQPWAGLLVLGIKEFETRSWNTNFRGEIAVHSSAKISKEGEELLEWLSKNRFGFKPGKARYKICTTVGAVLGTVIISDTFSTDDDNVPMVNWDQLRYGDFSKGRYFWECRDPKLFYDPILAKGKLKIWNWERPSNLQTLNL